MRLGGHVVSRVFVIGVSLLMAGAEGLSAADPDFSWKVARPAIELPQRAAVWPVRLGNFAPASGTEVSGVIRSRRHPGCFWTLNDSGNSPRIYAVDREAAALPGAAAGVLLAGARNVDWEDLAQDSAGHLIVADTGNNANERRDLALYYIPEPEPNAASVPVQRKILVRYPDQSEFPAPRSRFNFDCEAIFTVGETVFLLTKHRSDLWTVLYQLEAPRDDAVNVLKRVDAFEIGGMVTAADASDDGLQLVVLTYQAVWLFERENREQQFFDGKVSHAPIVGVQMESICFGDDKQFILADERARTLLALPMAELKEVRGPLRHP